VGETVEQSQGQVRGQGGGPGLVAVGEELEEELGGLAAEGHVAEFVNEHQVEGSVEPEELGDAQFGPGQEQFVDQAPAVTNLTRKPFRIASIPRPMRMWVLPVPGFPTRLL
jgi:hypothetical protein